MILELIKSWMFPSDNQTFKKEVRMIDDYIKNVKQAKTSKNTDVLDVEKQIYYCYRLYVGSYDYGGNLDERATVFPVLCECFDSEEEALRWLDTMKKDDWRHWEIKPYDYQISTEILELPYML